MAKRPGKGGGGGFQDGPPIDTGRQPQSEEKDEKKNK